MKRIIIVPLVGAIAALAVGSAAALTFAPGGVANIAAGSEAVVACGTVSDVSYVTVFDGPPDNRYEITSVVVTLTGTCLTADATLLSDAAADLGLGTVPVVANVATFPVVPGYGAADLDDIAVLVQ